MSVEDAEESCGECMFFLPYATNPARGICRRYPPKPIGDCAWDRPSMDVVAWCGEFKKENDQ